VFFQPAREYSGATGTVIEVAPSDVTIRTTAGVTVEAALAHAIDADGHWYVDTTDALYTANTKYLLWTTTTTSLGVVTEDHPFRHVVPSTVVVPGAPSVAFIRATDTTATFSNAIGAGATSTRITMQPKNGGMVIIVSGTATLLTATGLTPNTTYLWRADAINAAGSTPGPMGEFTTKRASVIAEPLIVRGYFNGETVQAAQREIDVKNELGGFTVGDDRAPWPQGTSALFVFESNHGNWWTLFDLMVRAAEPDMAPFGLGSRSRSR